MEIKANFLTSKQVAAILHFHVVTVRDKVRAGEIEAIKVGRQYLFTQKAISEYLNNQKIKA